MKILIDGRFIKMTGIGRYIEKMLEQILLLDTKNDYTLLVREKDQASVTLKADNLYLLPADIGWYGMNEQTKLLKLINRQKPDLVHFTNFNFPLAYRGKFAITIHDLTLLRFKNIRKSWLGRPMYMVKDMGMRLALSQAIHRARTILVPTEFVKEDVAHHYHIRRNKVVVTYQAGEAVNRHAKVNLEKLGINKPFLLYVGNAYPHKNLERLIIAFGKLITKYVLDYQLVIAGKKDDFHKSLEEEVRNSELQERVIFTDFISDQELAGLYKAASLYVFPSLSEGFGLPGLEAMSYGLPVVSSNETCLPEVYGDAAMFFNPRSTENMAKVISQVLADKDLQAKLVKKGHARVKQFSWKKTAIATLGVYEQILRNR